MWIGFYATVFVLALILTAPPVLLHFVDMAWLGRISEKFFFAGAGALMASAWPRRDPFFPPGVRLKEPDQPQIFALIRRIAGRSGERMPDRVYATGAMNAAVTDYVVKVSLRAPKRVLMVGLPLLQVLTVAELSAVLAHEFGHFAGGDTRLSSWLYRMRASMSRVTTQVDRKVKALGWLFIVYGRLFLRVTRTVSRQQEIAADAFAARLVGAQSLVRALRKVGPASAALDAYSRDEYLPIVEGGHRPPFLSGFAQFLGAPAVREWLRSTGRSAAVADPYDTHPPVGERVDRLSRLPPADAPEQDERAAVKLLQEVPTLELEVFRGHFRRGAMTRMPIVPWDRVGEVVAVPRLSAVRDTLPPAFWDGARLGQLAQLRPRLQELGARIAAHRGQEHDGADARSLQGLATEVLRDCALASLSEAGWRIVHMPGAGLKAQRGDDELAPEEALMPEPLGIDAARWLDRCVALGVNQLSLAPAEVEQPLDEVPALDDSDESVETTASTPEPARRRQAPLPRERPTWLKGLLVAVTLIAAVVWSAIKMRDPDAGPRLESATAAFRTAWNAGDLETINGMLTLGHRDPGQRMSQLQYALNSRGWHGHPPQVVTVEVVNLSTTAAQIRFDLADGCLVTHWRRVDSHWALATIDFPPPAVIEVIGWAPRPSEALRAKVVNGGDELLLFDVAYGVREATGDLRQLWDSLESARAEGMRALLDEMPRRCAGQDDAASVACANVAAVAAALLAHPKEKPRQLEPLQRNELRDVETAAKGSLRFVPNPLEQDWSIARPVGVYANERSGPEGIAGLYRATTYLRTYFAAWPDHTLATWRRQAETCRAVSATARTNLARVESEMPVLFGVNIDDSGALLPCDPPDRAWLRAHVAEQSHFDDKVAALFAAVPMSSPKSLSDGVLRLCHELTIAQPVDPLFGALKPAQWHAKWRDAASFAYIGLREVDCLAGTFDLSSTQPAATVVVEPLPAVWEALRWLDRRRTDPRPGDAWRSKRSWVDPVLEALAHQQKGEALPTELNDRLRKMLFTQFGDWDPSPGATAQIESVPKRVRRAVPQLVRVPIVWRGQTKKALALRLFVEQEGRQGK